jgi:hypothetical protein
MNCRHSLNIVVIVGLLVSVTVIAAQASAPEKPAASSSIDGPFYSEGTLPLVWSGDLRSLPQMEAADPDAGLPEPLDPRSMTATSEMPTAGAIQTSPGPGAMPPPLASFAGISYATGGATYPMQPNTNGDVGPSRYIQVANNSVAIFDKATGNSLVRLTFNNFFLGPNGTPCDSYNQGNALVLYDPSVNRWIVTNLATYDWYNGPVYECIAVSRTGDPVAGGWYFYGLRTDTGRFVKHAHDLVRLGVWQDGWYMAALQMQFLPPLPGYGVRVWALDRAAMIVGGPLREVHFDLCTDRTCGVLAPSSYRGAPPPAGAPNYLVASLIPDKLLVWKFHVDWATPANSSLSEPTVITVPAFASVTYGIPQRNTTRGLESISPALLPQVQYRNYGSYEQLLMNHVVNVNGKAALRWYDVRDLAGTPLVHQQGTYALGDGKHRWLGSIAGDRDGNIAVGYSVSNPDMFPAIRYAGRRNGEAPGLLPQAEASLVEGAGSQTGNFAWGDLSAMTIDPTDDCTFWYTNEYYLANGYNWQTRIGSFKFPSCGQPKGTLNGRVYDTVTSAGIGGVLVTLAGPETVTAQTGASGHYSIQVLPGTYSVTAGPHSPAYPDAITVNDRTVAAGDTTTTDVGLSPAPSLAYDSTAVLGGNGNRVPEPGDNDLVFTVHLLNNGAATADALNAMLSSPTVGVTVTLANSAYPDVPAGQTRGNSTPFLVSIAPNVACGTRLEFQLAVTSAQGPYAIHFQLLAGTPSAPLSLFADNFENGVNGWTTGGANSRWAQVTVRSVSPAHSWHDSPAGLYQDNSDSWLKSPLLNLSGKINISVSGFYTYSLETGFDRVVLEWSTDGGATWGPTYLAHFTGLTTSWQTVTVPAPMLDNLPNVALRYRLKSDRGVDWDGFYMDDFAVNYTPVSCECETCSHSFVPFVP